MTILFSFCFVGCFSTTENDDENTGDVWAIKYYVDEFNKPTNSRYITNVKLFSGTFSNSATTNSRLSAKIIIDGNGLYIMLWEYQNYQVKAYSATNYQITLRYPNGSKQYINSTMKKNSDRITIDIDKWEVFVGAIIDNTAISVHIEETSSYGYSSTYLFEIKQSNFNKVFSDYCL